MTGSAPPHVRARRPAQGKRKENTRIPRAGEIAAQAASATENASTGNRSGAPGGKPTIRRRAPEASAVKKRIIRAGVPGERGDELSVISDQFSVLSSQFSVLSSCHLSSPVVLLERGHARRLLLKRPDPLDRGRRRGGRRQARNPELQRRRADRRLIVVRRAPERGVDHQLDPPLPQLLHRLGMALVHLEDPFRRDPGGRETRLGPFRRAELELQVRELAGDGKERLLVIRIAGQK